MMLDKPNIKLAYIENTGSPLPDTQGTTHICEIVNTFNNSDEIWYDVRLLTDENGKDIKDNRLITIPQKRIIDRKVKYLSPKVMYVPKNDFVAKYFVIKSGTDVTIGINEAVHDKNKEPLTSTSRNGLGSGIFGIYNRIPSVNLIKVDMRSAYYIQDIEHSESITKASLSTSRYIDNLIAINPVINDVDIALKLIENNDISHLVTLWNIVFYRTEDSISKELLEEILAGYLIAYNVNDLFDTETSQNIIELPINFIMINKGFTGLIGSDAYNNSWDRGCVSYQYDRATKLIGNIAPY